MAELIISGPAGRIEARYVPAPGDNPPIALILHPHPKAGGTMQDPVTITLFEMFAAHGFSTMRFNFRGVGRSQGTFDAGVAELSDAAYVLDHLESLNEAPSQCWVAGSSFGAYICLQLLMRRPEIDGFVAVAPPANHYDLSFLAPCPASGIIISGDKD
ncbi:MAG TPA: alpha/beta hydrolase, partial [Hyphomonadaceae bacterium]|nr:alpha/beta hydrolase [Hyphomonadaceae bacterium]